MTHALPQQSPPEAQPTTSEDGRRIYGTTLPPSKRIPVLVRFWREDDPEVWEFAARPKLDVTTLRRVGGLMKMAEIQQYREQQRTQRAQDRARRQQRGEQVPEAAEQPAEQALPQEVLDSVNDILKFVGGMMTDRDGVPLSWDPDPTPHVVWGTEEDRDAAGQSAPQRVQRGKDVVPPPPDSPSWVQASYSIRLPDGRIVGADDPAVSHALSLDAASSKRRWHQLVVVDDDVDLGLDAIMELVGDLVGQWAGGEEGGRPLDGPSSSGSQPSSPASGSGSADV